MADPNTVPDLQSILATLSQYANPAVPFPVPDVQAQSNSGDPVNATKHDEDAASSTAPVPTPVSQHRAQDPRLRPQSRSATASPKPMIDPATITTWKEGLRCVSKISEQNAQFAARIKKVG